MTYNFDPDRWFENQLAILESRLQKRAITVEEFETERDRLAEELEAMLERLDIRYDYSET